MSWQTVPLRQLIRPNNRRNRPDLPLLSVVRDKGIIKRKLDKSDNHNIIPEDLRNYKAVSKGQFVINKMKAWQGSCGVSQYGGIVSPAYYVFDLDIDNPRFFDYSIRSRAFIDEFNRISSCIRVDQWDLSLLKLKYIQFPLPPSDEQDQIVRYLDWKVSRINKLINAKRRQIALLQEQKRALVNEAVTKGLHPNVPMKDSGVEWIGEIPAEWEVKKLKHITRLISKGTTPSTIGRDILSEGEVRFIKAENIVENKLSCQPEFYIDNITNMLLLRSNLEYADILFVIAGATIGKTAIVFEDILPANTNQAVSFIRLIKSQLPYFIWYYLQSNYVAEKINILSVQSAQPNLAMEDLGNFYLVCPSLPEQSQIAGYLDEKCASIGKIISKLNDEIALFSEYRTCLISDVVTGKLDVRGVTVPGYEVVEDIVTENDAVEIGDELSDE